MDLEKVIHQSIHEMQEVIETEEFSSKVDKDATVAFMVEYSKILLSNYHAELSSMLESHGIKI